MASGGDDEIRVPTAAKLLGVEPHTVYALIERGELHAEVIYPNARPRQRRSFHLTRKDVDDFLERARVKPGQLRHLHPNWSGSGTDLGFPPAAVRSSGNPRKNRWHSDSTNLWTKQRSHPA